MRNSLTSLTIFVLAIFLIASPCYAQNSPWCASNSDSGMADCSYDTEQQCLATVSGVGGMCNPNSNARMPSFVPTAPLPDVGVGAPMQLDPGPPPGIDAAVSQQGAPNNLFTAAGFTVKYANTVRKQRLLRSLPPDKLVKRTKDGKLYYVYADAAGCNCAYVGTAQAYAAYQNAPNDPTLGGGNRQSGAMQLFDLDGLNPIDSATVGGIRFLPQDIAPGIDGILHPDF